MLNLFQHLQAQNSVLSSGNWHKLCTKQEGIYQITYTDLQNYGINPSTIDPRNISIYGNGGRMLPQSNNAPKTNDLEEIAIKVIGEADGVFDPTDYILFYGQGADKWFYENQNFYHQKNLYDDGAYYFLTVSSSSGKRINTQNSSVATPNYTSNKYDNFIFHELDSFNLIQSGREWFGELFDTQLTYNFNYNLSNLDINNTATLNYAVAARSPMASQISVNCNSNNSSVLLPFVNMSVSYGRYAEIGSSSLNFIPGSTTISISFTYNKPDPTSTAWLNYFELITRNNLSKNNNQLLFMDTATIGAGNITQFEVSNTLSSDFIWEITQHNSVAEQTTTFNSGVTSFVLSTDSLRKFIAFDLNNLLIPTYINSVANQNLHGTGNPELVIITHPNFISAANNLANFHNNNNGISTLVATTEQVYNEFSSGAQDITAINNFMEYLYQKPGSSLKYLLLFGDASYDYKNRISPNSNYVPTYQSENSIDIIGSYTSDDYFGLLDSNEGTWVGNEVMDIAIGRLPVKTSQQANDIVNKIIDYKTNTNSYDDWRKTITFIGDDEDNNIHMAQADNLAEMVNNNHCNFNVEKIYVDEYLQVVNGQQQSYPEAEQKIVNAFKRGSLIVNYTGHGSNYQLAYENLIDTFTIDTLNNTNLPLMITASCETSRYDNPKLTPFGEKFLLHTTSGTIATYSSTRLLFSTPTFALNQSIYNSIFSKVNGNYKTIGEVFKEVKNQNNNTNSRNVTLLGDPALTLNFPEYIVNALHPDTLYSDSLNIITGQIEDDSGTLQNWFNGNLIVFIQGSKDTIITLANDGGSPFVFYERRDTIYYDTITITNGTFNFNINPSNIPTSIISDAKISYYAFSNNVDASGCNDSIYINDSSTGINNMDIELETNVYPNPCSDKIHFSTRVANNYTVHVYNNMGQTILSEEFSDRTHTLSVEKLNNGIYFYLIIDNKGKKSKGKIIVRH